MNSVSSRTLKELLRIRHIAHSLGGKRFEISFWWVWRTWNADLERWPESREWAGREWAI